MIGLPPITQTFNQLIGEYGNDFGFSPDAAPGPGGGAPGEGYPIYSPVAGVFAVEQKGKAAWGNRGIVMPSTPGGLGFAAGHLLSFAAAPGQRIKVGDLIGYSGGAVSDPNSGNTTGPHVEVQFFRGSIGSAANYLDPQQIPSVSQLEGIIFGGLVGGARATGAIEAGAPGLAGSLDPIAGLTGALQSFQDWIGKALWLVLGLAVIGLGLLLIVFEDFEGIGKAAAATVAKNPEMLVAA